MDIEQTLAGAQSVVTAKRVYGEPYERDGLTIIPAATVRGAGGGGGDDKGQAGGGFAVRAAPKGAWVIENGEVTWKPAVDVNRIVLGGQIVGLAAVLTIRELAKRRTAGRRRHVTLPHRGGHRPRHRPRHRLARRRGAFRH